MLLPEPARKLIELQRGALAGFQIQDLSRADRRRVREHPDLLRVSPRTWRHIAVASHIEQQLILAVLDAGRGAGLWGKAAASHWGFSRYRRTPAHVGVPRSYVRNGHLGQIHHIRDLRPSDIVMHLDVPTCRPERIILWLCGMMTHRYGHEVAHQKMQFILDQAWRQKLIDGHAIHALAERASGKGKSGIVVLRELLEKRPPDYQPAGSRLEERFEEIVSPQVARHLRRQVTVDADPVIRVVDFRLDKWPLVTEINGEAHHSSITAQLLDQERYDRFLELGWSVCVWWEHDVWHEPWTVRSTMDHLFRNPDEKPTLHRPTRAPWEL